MDIDKKRAPRRGGVRRVVVGGVLYTEGGSVWGEGLGRFAVPRSGGDFGGGLADFVPGSFEPGVSGGCLGGPGLGCRGLTVGRSVLATTYSRTAYRCTTIGAVAFHFRVRDGNGWFHYARVTRVGCPTGGID